VEADSEERRRRTERFAVDRLGDAVARLYERHAELLPDGPERTRAAATARSVAALREAPERWPFAPDVEFVDHRIVGLGVVHGVEPLVQAIHALLELMDEYAMRFDDVLCLRPDALLIRWTHFGTDRNGGAFERLLCVLWTFGSDGLVTRWE